MSSSFYDLLKGCLYKILGCEKLHTQNCELFNMNMQKNRNRGKERPSNILTTKCLTTKQLDNEFKEVEETSSKYSSVMPNEVQASTSSKKSPSSTVSHSCSSSLENEDLPPIEQERNYEFVSDPPQPLLEFPAGLKTIGKVAESDLPTTLPFLPCVKSPAEQVKRRKPQKRARNKSQLQKPHLQFPPKGLYVSPTKNKPLREDSPVAKSRTLSRKVSKVPKQKTKMITESEIQNVIKQYNKDSTSFEESCPKQKESNWTTVYSYTTLESNEDAPPNELLKNQGGPPVEQLRNFEYEDVVGLASSHRKNKTRPQQLNSTLHDSKYGKNIKDVLVPEVSPIPAVLPQLHFSNIDKTPNFTNPSTIVPSSPEKQHLQHTTEARKEAQPEKPFFPNLFDSPPRETDDPQVELSYCDDPKLYQIPHVHLEKLPESLLECYKKKTLDENDQLPDDHVMLLAANSNANNEIIGELAPKENQHTDHNEKEVTIKSSSQKQQLVLETLENEPEQKSKILPTSLESMERHSDKEVKLPESSSKKRPNEDNEETKVPVIKNQGKQSFKQYPPCPLTTNFWPHPKSCTQAKKKVCRIPTNEKKCVKQYPPCPLTTMFWPSTKSVRKVPEDSAEKKS